MDLKTCQKKKNTFLESWAVKQSSLYPGSCSVNDVLTRLMAAVKHEVNQGAITKRLKIHEEVKK